MLDNGGDSASDEGCRLGRADVWWVGKKNSANC